MLNLNSFRRVTTGKQLLEEIDGLRFLAIFYVIVAHLHGFFWVKTPFFKPETDASALTDTIGGLSRDGKHGVAIFFIISGFILALPFARYHFGQTQNRIALKDYFLRRLTRLEPPYILALVLLTIVIVLKNINTLAGIMPHFAASLFYVHNIVFQDMSAILPVAWSLEVEVQFYILAPFLSLVFALKKPVLRYALIVGAAVASAFFQEAPVMEQYFGLKYSLLGWLQYFLVGFLLADLYLNRSVNFKLPVALQLAAGLALLYGISFLPYDGGVANRLLYPLLCCLFFVLTLHFQVWKKVFSIPLISITGGMCYSIYLLHFATISAVGNYSIHYRFGTSLVVNYLVQALIIGGAIMAVSAAYFILVEKPCMRKDWPQRLWARLGGRKPAAMPAAEITLPEAQTIQVIASPSEPVKLK